MKEGIVSGYFSKFNNVDAHKDVIRPGAFKKSIQESGPAGKDRIQHLYQHDIYQSLAKITDLKEDSEGLFFVSKIVKTSYGTDVLKLYEAGVINEHSIGFRTVKDNPTPDYTELTELQLWEGSTVTWGANEEAKLTDIKSLFTPDQAIKRIDTLEKAIRKGTFTDNTFHLLIIQLKQLQQAFSDLSNSLKDDTQPEPTTVESTQPNNDSEEKALLESIININKKFQS